MRVKNRRELHVRHALLWYKITHRVVAKWSGQHLLVKRWSMEILGNCLIRRIIANSRATRHEEVVWGCLHHLRLRH